jgi:hypothetical protein
MLTFNTWRNMRTGRGRFAAIAAAFLLLVALAVWLFAPRDGDDSANVTLYEGDRPTGVVTTSEALRIVAGQVGFRPIVPTSLVIQGVALTGVRSILPPIVEVGAGRSHLIFISPEPEPQSLVMIGQSPVYWGVDLQDARSLDIGIEGTEVWALGPPRSRGPEYWLQAGGMFVYVLVGALEPVDDRDALPMLRSIAVQMANY